MNAKPLDHQSVTTTMPREKLTALADKLEAFASQLRTAQPPAGAESAEGPELPHEAYMGGLALQKAFQLAEEEAGNNPGDYIATLASLVYLTAGNPYPEIELCRVGFDMMVQGHSLCMEFSSMIDISKG